MERWRGVGRMLFVSVPKRLRGCQTRQPSGLSSLSTLVASQGRAGEAGAPHYPHVSLLNDTVTAAATAAAAGEVTAHEQSHRVTLAFT